MADSMTATATFTKVEKAVRPAEIAYMFGVSEEYVRAACARKENPVPCVNVATQGRRNYYRIRPSVFAQWRVEEEQRNA